MITAKQWTIYGLIDPRVPRAIRYVGITTDIRRRERQHRFKPSGEHNRGLIEWKMTLKAVGIELLAIPLETHGNLESAQEAERYFIRELRALNHHNLLNVHHGGAWCPDTAKSPEHRAKIGAAQKGRHGAPANAKQRAALAKGWAINQAPGHIQSPETRAKIGAGNRGKKRSPEHIEKLRCASTGRIKSVEERAKLSVANLGRPKSSAARAKMSEAAKNRSPEHRSKLSAAAKKKWPIGSRHTPETRARLSEAQRLRWQRNPMSAETKVRIGVGNKGTVRTAEHRAKMRAGHKAWVEAGAPRRAVGG